MPIENWKEGSRLWIGKGAGSVPLPHLSKGTSSIPKSTLELLETAPPVRMIISIEGTSSDWDTFGNL